MDLIGRVRDRDEGVGTRLVGEEKSPSFPLLQREALSKMVHRERGDFLALRLFLPYQPVN